MNEQEIAALKMWQRNAEWRLLNATNSEEYQWMVARMVGADRN
jgi:hypothetical protein